jgi:hypothetical protein
MMPIKHVNEITACTPRTQYTGRGGPSHDPTTREARIPAAHDRRAGDRRTGGNYDRDLDLDCSLAYEPEPPRGDSARVTGVV